MILSTLKMIIFFVIVLVTMIKFRNKKLKKNFDIMQIDFCIQDAKTEEEREKHLNHLNILNIELNKIEKSKKITIIVFIILFILLLYA